MTARRSEPYAALLWRARCLAPTLWTVTAETPDYYEVEVRDPSNWDLPVHHRRLPRPTPISSPGPPWAPPGAPGACRRGGLAARSRATLPR